MSTELISIPAYVINDGSPAEYSYLVATESPVVFQFQRNDGAISLAESAGSPDNLQITLDAGYLCADGDIITIYDSLYDRMIEANIVSDEGSGVFITDLPFEARYAGDLVYILNYTQRQNYYIEGRLTINGLVDEQTIKASANTKGLIKLDVSTYIRAKVSGEKVGNYLNNSDAEINQSGTFTLEYRERYTGESNAYTQEVNTWFYVYAIRSKEQGSNLWQYVATASQEAKWFNTFVEPTLVLGLPMDIQFFWGNEYADLSVVKTFYDASNNVLGTETTALNNASKGKLTSVKISQDSYYENLSKITVSIVEP